MNQTFINVSIYQHFSTFINTKSSASPETFQTQERRYPGRICGFSPSLEHSRTRRSLSPKRARMEAVDGENMACFDVF